jgi:hypothetical protein
MLPESELNALIRDTADAVNLAVVGEVSDGFEVLVAGLRRAEAMQDLEPWAGELAASYRRAVDHYCWQYRVCPVDYAPRPPAVPAYN